MTISKVYIDKEDDMVLYPSPKDAEKAGIPADRIAKRALISYMDGDIHTVCSIEDALAEYDKAEKNESQYEGEEYDRYAEERKAGKICLMDGDCNITVVTRDEAVSFLNECGCIHPCQS